MLLVLCKKLNISKILSLGKQSKSNPIKDKMIGSPLMHSNLYQQLPVVTWFSIEKMLPDLVCAVHLKTSRQFVASVFGIPLVVGIHSDL